MVPQFVFALLVSLKQAINAAMMMLLQRFEFQLPTADGMCIAVPRLITRFLFLLFYAAQ